MNPPQDPDARARAAKNLAAATALDEPAMLEWACFAATNAASQQALDDLSCALIDSIERQACPEFICALIQAGAECDILNDDGTEAWRASLRSDAMRPHRSERCSWMVVARLALGEQFLRHTDLPEVRRACDECVDELSNLFAEQDAHFQTDPNAANISELYAILDAKHDCALSVLLAKSAALRARGKPRK